MRGKGGVRLTVRDDTDAPRSEAQAPSPSLPPPGPIAIGPAEDARPSLLTRRRAAVGAAPGTLSIPPNALPVEIHTIAYTKDWIEEAPTSSPAEIGRRLGSDHVTWIDVTGFGDGSVLSELGAILGIHPLAVADIVHAPQRAKFEAFGDRHLIVLHMGRLAPDGAVDIEQLTLVLGPGWVVTFQERPGDVFDPVRERLRAGLGALRRSGPDYLAYALIDALVDGYFPVLEHVGNQLDDLEEAVLSASEANQLPEIHAARRLLIQLHRILWEQRDAIAAIYRTEDEAFGPAVHVYLRDTHDHSVQLLDLAATSRELASAILEIHLSVVSNRMNEVMKALTVMASIFIPLTFLAGIYGMNFHHMPELGWRWAYPAFWLTIVALSAALLYWFRRRGWLGRR